MKGGKNSLICIDNNCKQNNVQQIVTHKSSLADLTQTFRGWGWVQEKLFVAIDHNNVLRLRGTKLLPETLWVHRSFEISRAVQCGTSSPATRTSATVCVKRCRLFNSIYCACHRPGSRRSWMRFFRRKQSWKLRLRKVKGWRARTVEIKVRQQQMRSAVWRSSFAITRNEMGRSTRAKSLKCWSRRRRNRPRYAWSAERSSSMPVSCGR